MTLRTWLRSFLRPKQPPEREPKTASIVLIDMLNVINRDKYADRPRLRIIWSALRTQIKRELTGTTSLEGGLRAYYWPDRDRHVVARWLAQAGPSWKAAGYELIAKHKDDTDSQIVGAMHRLVARAIALHYDRVRVIIVSGDGIFGEEFEALKDECKGKILLELIVYAWPKSMNASLRKVSSRFYSLASVHGLMRQ